jgi:hypothetical protein
MSTVDRLNGAARRSKTSTEVESRHPNCSPANRTRI